MLFLLEQAGKAGKSEQKHRKRVIVKPGPFSKSIETRIRRMMLFLLGQAGKSMARLLTRGCCPNRRTKANRSRLLISFQRAFYSMFPSRDYLVDAPPRSSPSFSHPHHHFVQPPDTSPHGLQQESTTTEDFHRPHHTNQRPESKRNTPPDHPTTPLPQTLR